MNIIEIEQQIQVRAIDAVLKGSTSLTLLQISDIKKAKQQRYVRGVNSTES